MGYSKWADLEKPHKDPEDDQHLQTAMIVN